MTTGTWPVVGRAPSVAGPSICLAEMPGPGAANGQKIAGSDQLVTDKSSVTPP